MLANVKGLQEVEKLGRNECTLHRRRRSLVMIDCSTTYQSIAVQHIIQSMFNPPLMVYYTENGALLQKLPDKSQTSGKR